MWCAADEALLRREQGLPGMRVLLDEAALRARLQELNPRLAIGRVSLRYLRYKPGTNCLAGYEVAVAGGTVPVQAKTWRRQETAKLARRIEASGRVISSAVLRGGGWNRDRLCVEVFPRDAALPSLVSLADAEARAAFLRQRESLAPLADLPELRPLAYKPERRFVGMLAGQDGRGRAVVKVHTEGGFERALEAARAVTSGTGYGVARLLGKARRRRTLVYEWCEGQVMADALRAGDRQPGKIAEAGTALAAFHRQCPLALPVTTRRDLAAEVERRARFVGWLLPGESAALGDLAGALIRWLERKSDDAVVSHGDFHAGQALSTPGGIVLLDLDEAHRAPAGLDLGTFLAHLEIDVWAGWLSGAAAREAAAALSNGYAEGSGEVPAADVDGWQAVQLFLQSPVFFRRHDPGWDASTVLLLNRVRELLGRAQGGRSVDRRPQSPKPILGAAAGGSAATRETGSRAVHDPAMPFLSVVLDAGLMDRRLRELSLGGPNAWGDASLRSAALLRHKPGRRCLIEYRFESGDGHGFSWLGKARARRGEPHGARVAAALRRAGLDERSPIAVPEPLGSVPDLHLHLQRKVDGMSATALIPGSDGSRIAVRCAQAARALHDCGLEIARIHTIADELAILSERLGQVRETHGWLAGRVDRVLSDCRTLAARLEDEPRTLIHRDFYPDQVLIDGARTWVVDLDLCAMGDPCLDHGNFLAHLAEMSLRLGGGWEALRAQEEAYLEVAVGFVGAESAWRVRAHAALSLARHIQLSTQFHDRQSLTEAVLEECERRLAGRLRDRDTVTETIS